MAVRGLKCLARLGAEERLATISEGLGLLVENVDTLGGDVEALSAAGRRRAVWIVANHADEEAAKVLILIDLVRMDQRHSEAVSRQIGRFYNHLARRIYAELSQMSPADFAEVRRIVESMRPSHFLDGPNDVDWIFPNRLMADREERLYVDFVDEEEGGRWITPASDDEIRFGGPSSLVRDLVGALHRLGTTTEEGLGIVAEAWRDLEIDDTTHWQMVFGINCEVVEKLQERGLAAGELTQEDVELVARSWTFPLAQLEMSQIRVARSEVEAEQERWSPY